MIKQIENKDYNYYFAYGSNISITRLKKRIPNFEIMKTNIKLENFNICFHKQSKDLSGKATLMHSPNNFVYGNIYKILNKDISILDKYEGLNYGYNKINLKIDNYNCFSYIVDSNYLNTELKPFNWYLCIIIDGMIQNNFDKHYIEKFALIETIDDIDLKRKYSHYQLLENFNLNLKFDINDFKFK